MVKVPPWRCPSSAPVPPRGAPGGSGQLGTPRVRPRHWAPSHCLGCSSDPPPKSPISPPLTIQVSGSEASEQKRAAVVGAIRHAWGGYVKFAWGFDELKPVSKRSTDWIGLGLTILDSLDVLWMVSPSFNPES